MEPHNRRYASNYDLMQENKDVIIYTYIGSVLLWTALTPILMKIISATMASELKKNPETSSWRHI